MSVVAVMWSLDQKVNNPNEQTLLTQIAHLCDADYKTGVVPYRWLRDRCQIGANNTVMRGIHRLRDAGLVHAEFIPRRGSVYTLPVPKYHKGEAE